MACRGFTATSQWGFSRSKTPMASWTAWRKTPPKLDEMPGRFQAYGREPWRTRNPRGMPMDNCLVSYNPGSPGKTVTVPRVLCGGREIEAQPAIFRGEIVAVSFIPFPSGTQEVWWFGFH